VKSKRERIEHLEERSGVAVGRTTANPELFENCIWKMPTPQRDEIEIALAFGEELPAWLDAASREIIQDRLSIALGCHLVCRGKST